MRFVLLLLAVSVLWSSSTGLRSLINLGQALMGDLLSSLPSRLQCVGAGRNRTQFRLYTRTSPDRQRALVAGDSDLLLKSDFDPSLPTKVLVHGFIDNMHISDWMEKMKNKFLSIGEYNVILVDWSCGNEFPYFQAIQNSKATAGELKKLIYFLGDSTGVEPPSFHLIGHSLGSHIAALVGHAVPHLGRISALDPAGPRFYEARLEDRLDPTDADFVDVIHTDGGHAITEGMGMRAQMGHVDFYPNGGQDQPGCHNSPLSVLPKVGLVRAARYYLTCDHFRSIEYYLDSIRSPLEGRADHAPCLYVGVACRDWETYAQGRCADCASHDGNCAIMGYPSASGYHARHEYYVKTSEVDPFCLFQYQVIVETGCHDESCSGQASSERSTRNPGVLRLEVQTQDGKLARLHLDDSGSDKELKAGAQYVFLATSRFPLGQAQGAKAWFGALARPHAAAPPMHYAAGVNLKKIEILPIELPDKINRLSQPQVTVFCGPPDRTIGKNQYMELTVNDC